MYLGACILKMRHHYVKATIHTGCYIQIRAQKGQVPHHYGDTTKCDVIRTNLITKCRHCQNIYLRNKLGTIFAIDSP